MLLQRAGDRALTQEVCRAFNVGSPEELQDLLASLILSECTYKRVDMGEAEVAAKVTEFLGQFPADLVHLEAVQCSLLDVPQSYMVAVGARAVYVAFMGTKQARDVVADANAFHQAIWSEAMEMAPDSPVPTAHRGFLARSKAIDVEALYRLAADSGRHLVLCGHSLGGAVAQLCALRLLRELPEWPPPRLRCVTFATPPVGNAALADLVEAAGWREYFHTYLLAEDQLVRAVLGLAQTRGRGGGDAASAGGGAGGGWATGAVGSALASVASFVALPFTRESAKQRLREGLGEEEAGAAARDGSAPQPHAGDGAPAVATSSGANAAAVASAAPAAAAAAAAAAVAAALARRAPSPDAGAGGSPSASPRASWDSDGEEAAAAPPPHARPQSGATAGPGPLSGQATFAAQLPRNVALLLQLQRRWALYQLGGALRAARTSFTSATRVVSPYHPFGAHSFITSRGTQPYAGGAWPAPRISGRALAYQQANPGVLAFHRTMAYRLRCLWVVEGIAAALRRKGLRLAPPPGEALKPVRLGQVLPAVSVAGARSWLPLAPQLPAGSLPPAGPEGSASSAWARGPGSAPGASQGAAGAAAAAPRPAAAVAAAAAQRRGGPLAFLSGARSREAMVPLTVRVRGANLHLVRYVSVQALGEAFTPTDLSRPEASGGPAAAAAAAAAAAGAPPPAAARAGGVAEPAGSSAGAGAGGGGGGGGGGGFARLSALAHAFRGGARQLAAAVAQHATGARPAWRLPGEQPGELSLTVLLPRSTVAALAAAAHARPSDGAPPPPPPLVLQLKSDFSVVQVAVQLQAHRVGVLGLGRGAAELLGALLSGTVQLLPDPPEAAAAAASALTLAPSALQRWQRWLGTLRAPSGAAASTSSVQPAAPAVPDAAAPVFAPARDAASLAAAAAAARGDGLIDRATAATLHPMWVDPWLAEAPSGSSSSDNHGDPSAMDIDGGVEAGQGREPPPAPAARTRAPLLVARTASRLVSLSRQVGAVRRPPPQSAGPAKRRRLGEQPPPPSSQQQQQRRDREAALAGASSATSASASVAAGRQADARGGRVTPGAPAIGGGGDGGAGSAAGGGAARRMRGGGAPGGSAAAGPVGYGGGARGGDAALAGARLAPPRGTNAVARTAPPPAPAAPAVAGAAGDGAGGGGGGGGGAAAATPWPPVLQPWNGGGAVGSSVVCEPVLQLGGQQEGSWEDGLRLAAAHLARHPPAEGAHALLRLGWVPGAASGAARALASSLRQRSLRPVQRALGGWAAARGGDDGGGGGSSSWDALLLAIPLEHGPLAAVQQAAVASLVRAAAAVGVPLLPVLVCGGDAGSATTPAAFEATALVAGALGVAPGEVCCLEVLDVGAACADPHSVGRLPAWQRGQLADAVRGVRSAVLEALRRRLEVAPLLPSRL